MGWEYKLISGPTGSCVHSYSAMTLTNGNKFKFRPVGFGGYNRSDLTLVQGDFLKYTGGTVCDSTSGPFGYDVRYVDGDNISNELKFRIPSLPESAKTEYSVRLYPTIVSNREIQIRGFILDSSAIGFVSVPAERNVKIKFNSFVANGVTHNFDSGDGYTINSGTGGGENLFASSGAFSAKFTFQSELVGPVTSLNCSIDYTVSSCDTVKYSYVVVTDTTFEHDTGQEKNTYAAKIYHLNFGGLTKDLEKINFDLRCGYMKMGYNESTFKDTDGINPFNTSVNQDGYYNSPNWSISLNVDNTYGAVLYSPTMTSMKCGDGTNLSDNLKAAGNTMFVSASHGGIKLTDIFGSNAENVKRCTNFVLTVSCNDSNEGTDGNFSGECSSSVTYVNNEANIPYGDDFWFDIGTDPTQSFENINVSDTETHITYYGKLESASTNIYPRLNVCQKNGPNPCFYEIPYELDTARAELISQQSEGDPESFKSFNTTNELISARFYNFSLSVSRNGYISINVEGWVDPYEITERSIEIKVPALYRGEFAIPDYKIIFNWWDVSGS